MAKQPIVIIGAGIGGLSAAIRLAAAGQRVIVLEKNAETGGKMSQISAGGFRWDTGPSVITMRHVFEDLFRTAGRDLDDYLQLLPIDPLTRYFWQDGTMLDATSDLTRMAAEIEKFNPRDVEGYLAYLAYAARIHRITGPVFIYDQPPTPASFARVPITEWLNADPLRQMHTAINGFVKSPKLRQLLGRFATYVGGSPYAAPATLNVIAHVELTGGVWYPRGGVYSIAAAMTRLAQEIGVEICTNTPVKRILTEQQQVRGVELANGEQIMTTQVIANVDVTTVFRHLLPETPVNRKRLISLEAYEPSCSGFILLLGVEGHYPTLAHHNIFFSQDYRAEFQAIFKDQVVAQDPTVYLAITSKTDPAHAPADHENWFILVNAPPLSANVDWPKLAPQYRELVLNRLASAGYNIRAKIRHEYVLTPVDLQTMTGAWRGALYGPSSNSKWTAFRRPHNRSPQVKGLYFAGGTTHPGGGVPMVTLSGKVAAEIVLADGL
ncbi:MAG: phytoene desaturase family protein [Anaerolineae bacterium]